MGKNIISQRRGRGTTTYRSHSHRFKAEIKYRSLPKHDLINGEVIDLINCPGHSAPIAIIKFEDEATQHISASLNLRVGSQIQAGSKAALVPGNTLPLSAIPEGTDVFNLECKPGDGGKLCRASGTSAKIIKKLPDHVVIRLPSRKEKSLNSSCRATIGLVAGGGRLEKPLAKAGKNYHRLKARGKLYPLTSGVAMNAVDHPYGSGRGRQHAKKKVVSRHAPPGRKVGQVSARRTGRKK